MCVSISLKHNIIVSTRPALIIIISAFSLLNPTATQHLILIYNQFLVRFTLLLIPSCTLSSCFFIPFGAFLLHAELADDRQKEQNDDRYHQGHNQTVLILLGHIGVSSNLSSNRTSKRACPRHDKNRDRGWLAKATDCL